MSLSKLPIWRQNILSKNSRHLVHWVLDWDGTLTKRDTLNTLVNIAAENKPDFPVLKEWERLSNAYMEDYKSTLQHLIPDGKYPTTVSSEKALLKDLEPVEQRSVDHVSSSGIFQGLTMSNIGSGAVKAIRMAEVQLRDGCDSFFKQFQVDKLERPAAGQCFKNISLLSVNWSQAFIAHCLHATAIDKDLEMFEFIKSNEIGFMEGEQISSGIISGKDGRRILSSWDKLSRFKDLKHNSEREVAWVYIGDSWTDLECLLDADVGICIRDEPMNSTQSKLADALVRLEIDCLHINDEHTGPIIWARDFEEIQEWMSGH
jgi:thiamine phosphate phosphatase / amino-HMP aminohydrolase